MKRKRAWPFQLRSALQLRSGQGLLALLLLPALLALGFPSFAATDGDSRGDAPRFRNSKPRSPFLRARKPKPAEPAPPAPEEIVPELVPMPPSRFGFSADRAFLDLEALAAIGPRVSGTQGRDRARSYLEGQLGALGATVSVLPVAIVRPGGEPVEAMHLVAELPGESSDLVILAAHYDSFPVPGIEFIGANDGASGAAVVLELGRALAEQTRPYTVRLLLLDGDALPEKPGGSEAAFLGSQGVSEQLAGNGELERVRVAFFFSRVADPDLQIVRDLRSHRSFREELWTSAREVGADGAFPADAGFESPEGAHRSFLDRDFRRVVAVTDDRFGGDSAPGLLHYSVEDRPENCSRESLQLVGDVTLDALGRIQARLSKIDRFVSAGSAAPASPQP